MQTVQIPGTNHVFYEFTMTECNFEIQWARDTAYRKANHTADTWQGRSACKKFTNVFLGDLAKNIFKKFVLSNNPNISNSLIEYDLVRSDDFKNRDEFDLKLLWHGEECIIEVKSSGEKYTSNLMEIYSNRRIIINVGNVHQHFACIYAQIIFIPENLTFFQNEDFVCNSLKDFTDQYLNAFLRQNIRAYIVGYANEPMQITAVQKVITINNQSAGTKTRDYADLYIRDSKSPHLFIQAIAKN